MNEIKLLKAVIEDLKSDNLILKQTLLLAQKEYSDNRDAMTLRDHFAGLAMQGFATNNGYIGLEYIAKDAYALTDAMLKERSKSDE